MPIITARIPTRPRSRFSSRRRLPAFVVAAALLGCGTTEPTAGTAGTAGRYMLAGCTAPGGGGVPTVQACNTFEEWDRNATYYELGTDGGVRLVLARGFLSLGSPPQISTYTGSWTESTGTIAVTWDATTTLVPRTLERIDSVTLRDNRISFDTSFWFVKAP